MKRRFPGFASAGGFGFAAVASVLGSAGLGLGAGGAAVPRPEVNEVWIPLMSWSLHILLVSSYVRILYRSRRDLTKRSGHLSV